MRPKLILSVSLLACVPGVATAESAVPRLKPTVVFEGRSTISAHPYFRRIENRKETSAQITVPSDATTAITMEDRLPIAPTLLQVGTPEIKVIDGLVTPLFVMGMDDLSLTWFRDAAPGLANIGARGIVIEAASKSAWLDLKASAAAAGIDLLLMEGDSLAQGYNISTYPMVFVSPEVAGQGADE